MRGFDHASLDLSPDLVVLVGPNNAGKTSVLRLLDWIFNAPAEAFAGDRRLDEATLAMLRPARNTRNKARRLTLRIHVDDGRRHHRFRCVDGVASVGLACACRLTQPFGSISAHPGEGNPVGTRALLPSWRSYEEPLTFDSFPLAAMPRLRRLTRALVKLSRPGLRSGRPIQAEPGPRVSTGECPAHSRKWSRLRKPSPVHFGMK